MLGALLHGSGPSCCPCSAQVVALKRCQTAHIGIGIILVKQLLQHLQEAQEGQGEAGCSMASMVQYTHERSERTRLVAVRRSTAQRGTGWSAVHAAALLLAGGLS